MPSTLRPLLIIHALAGDLLMAVPALRALGQRFGFDCPLVCGIEPEHQTVLTAVGFTQLRPTLFQTRDLLPGETLAIPCDWGFDVEQVLVATQGCNLILNLTDACGPSFNKLVLLSGLPSLGFHSDSLVSLEFFQCQAHVMDGYFQLARHILGNQANLISYAAFPHRGDALQIRKHVREATQHRRFIALHADTKPGKMWPLTNWAAWLQCLWHDEPETQVVLLGYPAIPIEHYALDERLHDCRDLPLTVNYEIAGMADLFVGIDSCMIHAADLCRVPSVGLYTDMYPPRIWGLRFADGEMLQGHNPPDNISVEQMWDAYCRVRDRHLQSL